LNTPQIVCYKSGRLNYEIGKRLIKVPYISLVNLIFEKEIVKELIQGQLNEDNLFFEINQLLKEENYTKMQLEYSQLRTKLGDKNASKSAAEVILAEL
jgi:lipid-A-disaccharide synthase